MVVVGLVKQRRFLEFRRKQPGSAVTELLDKLLWLRAADVRVAVIVVDLNFVARVMAKDCVANYCTYVLR